MYDSNHVGITSTGEQDTCELYYNDTLGLPADINPEDTALEQYRRFSNSPEAFLLTNSNDGG